MTDTERHPMKEKRRANKPLLERKRRARINNSLNDMKHLVLSFLNKDATKFTKMEKVDILDMTVHYLQQQFKSRGEQYSSVYRSGYEDCKHAMYQNIMAMDIDLQTKYQIMSQMSTAFENSHHLSTPPPSPSSERSSSPLINYTSTRIFLPSPNLPKQKNSPKKCNLVWRPYE
ncbi:transcription factor HES-2 [Hydra vulgaris]|uniref:Transcription factor HES-2 n=1 Tax=Hydra vulgaris TaxID=6087 RepID=T2M2P3_HYDVU|nr:transcription factor HES-2 [Hydra vulgaris]